MIYPKQIKMHLINVFLKFLKHQTVQNSLNENIRQIHQLLPNIDNVTNPYFELPKQQTPIALREDPIFITSRFRSGSTLLWNLFRQIDSCTSFYEPFNERQWFNPSIRGSKVDDTHRGVNDYWAEYEQMEELRNLYNEDWIREALLMTEASWSPLMKSFIEKLIELSPKRPVLQFNRIDFRLPWIKHHFPNAKILHLHRNPRDQWCSFLTDSALMNKDKVESTYHDAFYLDVWCTDLAKHYPFLDPRITKHPYQRFYLLWKLSYLFGQKYADYSFSYDQLISDPTAELQKLLTAFNIKNIQLQSLLDIFASPAKEKWKTYADEDWFIQHEAICETILNLWLSEKKI
jgi:hypothetical protein